MEISAGVLGYRHVRDGFFVKDVAAEVAWFFQVSLWNSLPYSVFASIGYHYVTASQRYTEFLQAAKIECDDKMVCSFAAAVDRHASDKTLLKIGDEAAATAVAVCFVEKVAACEKSFLEPRLELAAVVQEYLQPIIKWPSGDLKKCCAILLGHGLLQQDQAAIHQGMARVFDILNRPDYSQTQRDFFEALKSAIEQGTAQT